MITEWIDARITVFGTAFADQIVTRCRLDDIGLMFGDWLLGLNEQLKHIE